MAKNHFEIFNFYINKEWRKMSHTNRNPYLKTVSVLISFFFLFSLKVNSSPNINTPSISEGCATIANPAYTYCTQIMGYDYQIITELDGGQDGVCIMPDGDMCPQWDFYAGKCGQEHSYCVQHGMQLEIRKDGKDPFSVDYSVCVDNQGNEMGTLWSLSEFKMITDLDDDQLNLPMLGEQVNSIEILNNRAVPSSFDWRNYSGADWITPVKNQANCGSCWAFSAVGLTEAQHNIMASDPTIDLNLSEQYLVSTCFDYGDCDGGVEPYALQYIRDTGVPDEACYPYRAENSPCLDRCSDYASRLINVPNAKWTHNFGMTGYTEQDIKFLLSNYGPVTLAIGTDPTNAGSYWDGNIFRCTHDIPSDGSDYIDHAVLAVGYNDTGGYWIVKNSWGSSWNGDGYFKLGYNECNVAHSRISWVESSLPGGNVAPTNITLSKTSVQEGQPIDTVVGMFTTVDLNPGDTHTYSLVSGTGSTDNTSFNILGNQLRTSQVFDKAVKDTYTIRVRSTDQGDLFFEKQFTITVTDTSAGGQIYLPLIINGGGSSPIISLQNGDFEAGPDGSWTEYSYQG
jgi:C1A family cysteine protease